MSNTLDEESLKDTLTAIAQRADVVSANTTSAARRARRRILRNTVSAALGLTLAIVGGVSIATKTSTPSRPAPPVIQGGLAPGRSGLHVMDIRHPNHVMRITDDATDSQAAWSPDGLHIAFTRGSDQEGDIWIADANGSNARRLTRSPYVDDSPSWTPDGKTIVFGRFIWEGAAKQLHLKQGTTVNAISIDGGTPRQLLEGFAPSVSPDGRAIAYVSWSGLGNGTGIYVARIDGSARRRIFATQSTNLDPTWSPDGRRIAFQSTDPAIGGNNLSIIGVDGSSHKVIGGGPWAPQGFHPSWSNNGILVSVGGIWWYDDRGPKHAVSIDPNVSDKSPAWSPDGQRFVFSRTFRSPNAVFEAVDGVITKRFGGDAFFDSAVVSPDGQATAFVSTREGFSAIYIADRNGFHPRRISGDMTAIDPAWSSDGNHLAFVSWQDGSAQLVIVDHTGANRRVLLKRAGGIRAPRWSSDGQRIFFVQSDEREPFSSQFPSTRVMATTLDGTATAIGPSDADGPAPSSDNRLAIVTGPRSSGFQSSGSVTMTTFGRKIEILDSNGRLQRDITVMVPYQASSFAEHLEWRPATDIMFWTDAAIYGVNPATGAIRAVVTMFTPITVAPGPPPVSGRPSIPSGQQHSRASSTIRPAPLVSSINFASWIPGGGVIFIGVPSNGVTRR